MCHRMHLPSDRRFQKINHPLQKPDFIFLQPESPGITLRLLLQTYREASKKYGIKFFIDIWGEIL